MAAGQSNLLPPTFPGMSYEAETEANGIRCQLPLVGPSHEPSLLLSRRCRNCEKWRQHPYPMAVFHPNNDTLCFCAYCGIHMPIPMRQSLFYFSFVHIINCPAKLPTAMVCTCHSYLPIEILCLPNPN